MMLLFESIWKNTLYCAYKRHGRKVLFHNFQRNRTENIFFPIFVLLSSNGDGGSGGGGRGYEGCAKRTTRSFGKHSRIRSLILPVPILLSTSDILVRSLTFENESLSWMDPQSSAASPVTVFVFYAFPFFPYCVFTFISSILNFTLDLVSSRIIYRKYKEQVNIYARIVHNKTHASAIKSIWNSCGISGIKRDAQEITRR